MADMTECHVGRMRGHVTQEKSAARRRTWPALFGPLSRPHALPRLAPGPGRSEGQVASSGGTRAAEGHQEPRIKGTNICTWQPRDDGQRGFRRVLLSLFLFYGFWDLMGKSAVQVKRGRRD